MALVTVIALVIIYMSISKQAESALYHSINKVPAKKAALVLGTAKYMIGGGKNYFYTYRIRAAADLFKAGKVNAIVVSVDHSTKYYNERDKIKK